MADSLSRKLTMENNVGTIPRIKSASDVESINHALFADDTLLLGGASLRLPRVFKDIMQHFCTVSGALINNRKSAVYGWNATPETIANISHLLGFEGFSNWNKVKYLGLPLTLGQNNPSRWLEIVCKLKS